jgi:hypothetical protein
LAPEERKDRYRRATSALLTFFFGDSRLFPSDSWGLLPSGGSRRAFEEVPLQVSCPLTRFARA